MASISIKMIDTTNYTIADAVFFEINTLSADIELSVMNIDMSMNLGGFLQAQVEDAVFSAFAGVSIELAADRVSLADFIGGFLDNFIIRLHDIEVQLAVSFLEAFVGSGRDLENGHEGTGVLVSIADFGLVTIVHFNQNADGSFPEGESLVDVSFALAGAGEGSLIGIEGVTLDGAMKVRMNTTGGAFKRSIDTGGQPVEISFDETEGDFAVVEISANVGVYDFFYLSGNFALEKTTTFVTLRGDTEQTEVSLLTIGASNGRAFAGVNGPQTNPEAVGFYITDLSFAIALMSVPPPEDKNAPRLDKRNWAAVKVSIKESAFIGVEGLTLKAEDFYVAVNQAGGENDGIENTQVVDFSGDNLIVNTGGNNTETIDFSREFLTVEGTATLSIFGFFYVHGSINFTKTTFTAKLNDDSDPVEVDLMTIGASGVDAFAGLNGPADKEGAVGFSLTNVNFALAMMKVKQAPRPPPARAADVTMVSPGPGNDLRFTAQEVGTGFNNVTVSYVNGTTPGAVYDASNPDAKTLTITVVPGETTAAKVIELMEGVPEFSAAAAEGATDGVINTAPGSTEDTGVDPVDPDLGTAAFATISSPGAKNDLTFTAKTPGVAFNNVKVVYVNGAAPAAVYDDSNPDAKTLTITVKPGVTTAGDIITLLNNDPLSQFTAETADPGDDGEINTAPGSTGETGRDEPVPEPPVAATATVVSPGDNNDLTFTATEPGIAFNDVRIEYVNGEEAAASYDSDLKKLTVTVEPGVTRAAEIITLMDDVAEFSAEAAEATAGGLINTASGSTEETGTDASGGNPTAASVTITSPGPGNDLTFTAFEEGTLFNNVTVEYVNGPVARAAYDGEAKKLTVTVVPGVTTAAEIITLLDNVAEFEAVAAEGTTDGVINTAAVSTGTTGQDEGGVKDLRSWTALKASVGGVEFVGLDIEGLTLEVSGIAVAINQGGGTLNGVKNKTVVDFTQSPLTVDAGAEDVVFNEWDSAFLMAEATVKINLFGFFYVSGSFAFEKKDAEFVLSDNSLVQTEIMTIGASNVDAFAGVNGPYWIEDLDEDGEISWALPDGTPVTDTGDDDIVDVVDHDGKQSGDIDKDGKVDANETAELSEDAMGFSLIQLDFALALIKPKAPKIPGEEQSDKRTWIALKASTAEAALVGIDGITLSVTDFAVSINQGSGNNGGVPNGTVIDFSVNPLEVNTGGGNSLIFDFAIKLL